jgi:3-hydroxyisobutyrate dehydrogenase-like beta-hydroxyacid dehydrogenase
MGAPVGFIGLGNIGLPAARNLIERGWHVVGYSLAGMEAFVAAGGDAAGSAADVAARCDVIIQCLPVAAALEAACYGPEGVLAGLRPGAVVIELSSYALADKIRLRDALAAASAGLLDCEITARSAGRSVSAREAVIFLGGDRELAERHRGLLEALTDHCVYVGPFGASLKVKTVNNLLVGVNALAAAEAMSLGVKAGIDPGVLAELLPRGAGGSAALSNYAPAMARRDFDSIVAGEMGVFAKYFALIEDLAAQSDAATPLADIAARYVRRALAQGEGKRDMQWLFAMLESETRS